MIYYIYIASEVIEIVSTAHGIIDSSNLPYTSSSPLVGLEWTSYPLVTLMASGFTSSWLCLVCSANACWLSTGYPSTSPRKVERVMSSWRRWKFRTLAVLKASFGAWVTSFPWSDPLRVSTRGLTHESAYELAILIPAGRMIGRHARTIPRSGSKMVNTFSRTVLYVASLLKRSRQKANRSSEIMQILYVLISWISCGCMCIVYTEQTHNVPRLNRIEISTFFLKGICNFQRTGIGKIANETSITKFTACAVI